MVGIIPALLEGTWSVATPLVVLPRKRSMPPPLRLEGAAEKAAGSTIADAFPAADVLPGDPPESDMNCEVGVTCDGKGATNPLAPDDEASEAA